MKIYRYLIISLILCMSWGLSSCSSGPLSAVTPATTSGQTPVMEESPAPTGTAKAVPSPLVSPQAFSQPTANPKGLTSDPQEALLQDVTLADNEMKAACQSTTLSEAKNHAEAVVNIIGGSWGLWYGDGNGDGQINDPSDRQGILPAGIVQSSANIDNAHLQLGLAIIAYEQGGSQVKNQSEELLGNISQWMNNPMAAWANVAKVVEGIDLQHPLVAKLPGSAVRQMAWARLVLVKANTLQGAQQYACNK